MKNIQIFVSYDPFTTVEYSSQDLCSEIVLGSQMVADNTNYSCGVVSGYGSFSVHDKFVSSIGGTIYNAIVIGGLLNIDEVVKVTIKEDGRTIGTYDADFSFNVEKDIMDFNLFHSLSNWGELKFSGFNNTKYFIENPTTVVFLSNVFNVLKTQTEAYGEEFEETPLLICNYALTNIRMGVVMLEETNLLDAWNAFCEAFSCCVYKNKDGKIEVTYYG